MSNPSTAKMSRYSVGDEKRRPENFGGDKVDVSKSTCRSDDDLQRDSLSIFPPEPTRDCGALAATFETGDSALVHGLKELDVNDSNLENKEYVQFEHRASTGIDEQSSGANHSIDADGHITEEDQLFARERKVVLQYLLDNVAEYRELSEIRQKGWDNPEGDRYFERQRYLADNPDEQTSKIFLGMMQRVGAKMQEATGVFTMTSKRPSMLALGCAPGGFVGTALKVSPDVQVIGITLPVRDNGVECLVKNRRLSLIEADVTMLAADLLGGAQAEVEIPAGHPDAGNFLLRRQIRPRQQFDLVTCEGGVLRTHEVASYREHREAWRLKTSQLALGLARVRPGGRMVVLMHKAEARDSLCVLYAFSGFSEVRLFKPDVQHQHRSSFYMVATDVQSQSEAAQRAVRQWTSEWRVATFGTDEEYREEMRGNALDTDEVLREFGEEWVRMSREVWDLQIKGLQRKSFTK